MVAVPNSRSDESAGELSVMVSDVRDEYSEALRLLLEPHGFSIHRVRSGADAIRLAERRAVDAAVLDNDLPDMPGLRVIKVIRSLDLRMPIILVGQGQPAGGQAAGEQEHLLRSALQLQAFSVLARPVDLEVLLGQMARVFDRFVRAMLQTPPEKVELDPPGVAGEPGPAGESARSGPAVEPEPMRQIGRRILRFRRRG